MSRSLCNAKVISSLIALIATRRGYSAAAQGVSSASSAVKGGGVTTTKKVVEESSPWGPDPVTGYYKPENHFNDVNVAELHEMFLKNKISRDH